MNWAVSNPRSRRDRFLYFVSLPASEVEQVHTAGEDGALEVAFEGDWEASAFGASFRAIYVIVSPRLTPIKPIPSQAHQYSRMATPQPTCWLLGQSSADEECPVLVSVSFLRSRSVWRE